MIFEEQTTMTIHGQELVVGETYWVAGFKNGDEVYCTPFELLEFCPCFDDPRKPALNVKSPGQMNHVSHDAVRRVAETEQNALFKLAKIEQDIADNHQELSYTVYSIAANIDRPKGQPAPPNPVKEALYRSASAYMEKGPTVLDHVKRLGEKCKGDKT